MAHGRTELFEVIRQVRNRWRRRLAARGALIVLAGTVLALLVSAHGLETFRFSAPAIIAFRVVAAAVFGALVFYGLVRPLGRQVTDTQVALYLEESNPKLEAAILSAIEATSVDPASALHSPRLLERLVEQAIGQAKAIDHKQSIDYMAFQRHVVAFGSVAALAAVLVVLGPAYLRHGLSALLRFTSSAEASTPYRIEVQPGNTKVPRGGDQTVKALLVGFTSKDVNLMMHTAPGAPFERVPLLPAAEPGAFEGVLFHLDKQTEYFVESNGVRSPVFSVSVVDLPTVATLDLEYIFPSYTSLPPRQVQGGGDVAALKGTDVRVRITPTMASPRGAILLKDGTSNPLTVQADGSLTGSFTIVQNGFYRIQLVGPHGEQVDASQQYTIDALDDMPPSVSFTKPGRDTSASPVEEVFAEVKADDDFGVKSLQLFYSVNGGAQKTVSLFGGGKALTAVSAGHTLYLEELGLKPGDFVSYFAKATDNDSVPGPHTTSSDIYFVQIRPFKKDYKPAQSAAQGGGGGQQGDVGDLSRQQREIVAATFNTVRDRTKTKVDKYRENVVFLNLAQAKLRAQVEDLVEKLNARMGGSNNETFKKIAEALPRAAAEMKTAEGHLKALKPDDALTPEQKALKLLQDAEQQYEMQVSQQNGQGSGGQQQAMADDLADLFELELDKLANQYEMQKRADQQTADQQVDQMAEKLKELARRQQQEAERQRRLAQAGQSPQQGAGSGGGQRTLAEEAQEAARRLEQLSREQQRPDLADAARQMQQAADAMKQAAANGEKDGGAQANAALEKLRDAQRKLDQNQAGRSDRDIQDAQRRAKELADEQKQVASDVQGLDQAGAARQSRAETLAQRKASMDTRVGDLQQQLEKLANETRKDQRDASKKLDEAAGSIRDQKIREKIRYSKGALQQGSSQYAQAMEASIGSNLDALQKKIGEAAAAMGQQDKQDAMARAADQARDLVRSLESLDQRLRDRAASGGKDPQSQDGRAGQQRGQQGQGGEQGQPSAEGRQGQQGQPQPQTGQQGGQGGGRQTQTVSRGQGNLGQGQAGNSPNVEGNRATSGEGDSGQGQARLSNEESRQLQREYQELSKDAQELRQRLQQAGVNAADFDQVLKDLQGLGGGGALNDPKAVQKLQADALDRLKKFEFSLRRKLGDTNDALGLSGSDEVPAGFRQAIEEYYRLLAKKQTR